MQDSFKKHPVSHLKLRKPQRLRLDKRVQNLSDLSAFHLATSIAHIIPGLTEQSLMRIGGELYQVLCLFLAKRFQKNESIVVA